MDKKILNIVITGGPCDGKTTALDELTKLLRSYGYTVYLVNETATELITDGIRPFGDNALPLKDFQEFIFDAQQSVDSFLYLSTDAAYTVGECEKYTNGSWQSFGTRYLGNATGFKDNIYNVRLGDEVRCTVGASGDVNFDGTIDEGKSEYIAKTESISINSYAQTLKINPNEKTYMDGTFIFNDMTLDSNGNTNGNLLSNNHPGYYLVQLWGGKGGDGQAQAGVGSVGGAVGYGGDSGYVQAVIFVGYDEQLYYTIGGNGQEGATNDHSIVCKGCGIFGRDTTTTHTKGGPNNIEVSSGTLIGSYTGDSDGGSGGGYSLLAKQTNANTRDIYMIAGGGGGGSGPYLNVAKGYDGGAGGVIDTNSTTCPNSISGSHSQTHEGITLNYNAGCIYNGSDGAYGDKGSGYQGTGGSGVAGYSSQSQSDTTGAFLLGGNGKSYGGSGGAGLFGGGGSYGNPNVTNASRNAGAGGGSSYIWTVNSNVTTNINQTATNYLLSTNPSSTGGTLFIKYLGRTYN